MATTAQELAQLIVGNSATTSNVGSLTYIARHASAHQSYATTQYLKNLIAQRSEESRSGRATPRAAHPAAAATRDPMLRRTGRNELSAADLVWLQRLPSDPKEVTWQDAVSVAKLAANVDRMNHPDQARLIDSIWAPINVHHSRRVADEAIKAARAPLPAVPDGAAGVLAEALVKELPPGVLTDAELATRAHQLLNETKANAARRREEAITASELRRAAIEVEEADRNAMIRDTIPVA